MRFRRATRAAVAVGVLVTLAAAAVAAVRVPEPRLHRLVLPPPESPAQVTPAPPPAPPPPPPPLSSFVGVDEDEWSLTLSRILVAAGDVTFRVFNRGEDDHDLAVLDANGVLQKVDVPTKDNRTLVVRLPVGISKIFCSLPGHEALGMVSYLEARTP